MTPPRSERRRPAQRVAAGPAPTSPAPTSRATTSLAAGRPELVAEWHPTKNEGVDPSEVTLRTTRPVWWRCAQDPSHEWRTAVVHRTKRGSRCPYCVGRRATPTTSLAALVPEVAAEWHPTKNAPLTAHDVTRGSSKLAWWVCPLDPAHEWQARVAKRTAQKTGCPHCLGKTKHTRPGDLGAMDRRLAREWHPTKNAPLRAADVTRGSNLKVWWRCGSGHEWAASVQSRATVGTGCPYCGNRAVDESNCLATTSPALAAQWHPTKNGARTPRDVVAGSGKKVWWRCPAGADHEWAASPSVRQRSPRCPFCINQRVSRTNVLAKTHPAIARQWHPTKNGALTPRDVVAGSNKSVWWRCLADPEHAWTATCANRTMPGAVSCPFCSGDRVSSSNALATVFPEIAAEWHPTKNGALTPREVLKTSPRKVWWKCPRGDDHAWETAIAHRTRNHSGCPFCAGSRASATHDLAALRPDVAAEWHPTKNRPLTPADVTPGSRKRVWWRCRKGPDHEWEAVIGKRAHSLGACPFCAGRLPSLTNSIASLFPELAREWHPTKNGGLTPGEVVASSTAVHWWLCPRRHPWRASARERMSRPWGCPECARQLGR